VSLFVSLRQFFTPVDVARRLEAMPPIVTTVTDTYFKNRTQYDTPVIPLADILAVTRCAPVISRGAPSIPVNAEQMQLSFVEPLSVRIHDLINAVEANNLKLLGKDGKEAWAMRRQLQLRNTVRLTIEALNAQALFDGAIDFPLLLSSGAYARYKVSYGTSINNFAPDKAWDAAGTKLMDVYLQLDEIDTLLKEAGHGGQVEFCAGKKAYAALLGLAQAVNTSAKVNVAIGQGQVEVNGFTVKKMAETYVDPETGTAKAKIADDEIRAVTVGTSGQFFGPVDDLAANLQPLPFFVKPVEIDDPSGIRLVAESKPLPAVAPRSVCKAKVTNLG